MTYEIDMLFSRYCELCYVIFLTLAINNALANTCTGKTNNQLIAAFNALVRRIIGHQLKDNSSIIVYYMAIRLQLCWCTLPHTVLRLKLL